MRSELTSFLIILLEIIFVNCETCAIPTTGQEGTCIPLIQCHHVQDELKKDRTKKPIVCDRRLRTICCPSAIVDSHELGVPETQTLTVNNQQQTHLSEACSSYRDRMTKNQTVASFIIGEPAGYQTVNYCNTNHKDIGVAVEKEFPHVAYIQSRRGLRDEHGKVVSLEQQVVVIKCSGSLISENFVLTTSLCVSDTRHDSALVYFGVLNLTTEFEYFSKMEVPGRNIKTLKELSLLKLLQKVETNEMVMPICLSSATSEKFVLTGWTGYKYECNPLLKKWYIEAGNVKTCKNDFLCIESANIVNYHEMLHIGSSLQVYHPESSCQYILKGLFKRIFQEKYEFIALNDYKAWIERHLSFYA